ncbi:methyltransferase domain-containing protein [Glycomyces sp. L485]|uniref:methyltransferase domain-containing protein n=1 Tax=Glycomyces sp. L485 TaxID=2909235 RepID=UPI001F4A59E5|nr:methyltransferase domain-containing protein [Glycomyces sp. L485]MCH7229602.1 methyltransferase domain-containing protein [Glycomyces sp. L485]
MHTTDAAAVGDGIEAGSGRWNFAGRAAEHFDAHVHKSVPGYADGHRLVLELSDWFVGPDSTVYDLGCATGALLAALAERHADLAARFIGVDVEPDMVAAARSRTAHLPTVEVRHADAAAMTWEAADLVVGCYTLQFLPSDQRGALVERIHRVLRPGGALVLFEKVLAPDARLQDIASALYVEHKLSAGFTPAEIVGKARSLKRILTPWPTGRHVETLHAAGFPHVMTIYKNISFEGFLAIKEGPCAAS